MLLTMLAGWNNREQQHMIEYLKEENSIFLNCHRAIRHFDKLRVTRWGASLIVGM